jgi:hypothetical protein
VEEQSGNVRHLHPIGAGDDDFRPSAQTPGAEGASGLARPGLAGGVEDTLISICQAVARLETRQTQTEAVLDQLRDEHVHGSAALKRMNDEQILVLNQIMGRISGLQSEIGRQRQRSRGLLIAVICAALAVVGMVALLVAALFYPPA